MNFNLFSQISKIVGRQINNITKNITRVVKMAAKPFVYLNAYVRAQVKSMTRRPSSKADYVRFGQVYLSKRFLGFSVIASVLVVTVFSTVIYPWLEGKLWTPTILLNSQKMAGYTGPARIKNDMGTVIYVGDVVSGKLTGDATQYDTEGELVYTGAFQDAAYSGYGSYYVDGVLRYEGDFAKNLYDGEGRLYDEEGSLIYQGSFAQGLRSGKGMHVALEKLAFIESRKNEVMAANLHELMRAHESFHLLRTCMLTTMASLERRETRFVYRRSDYPDIDHSYDDKLLVVFCKEGAPYCEWRTPLVPQE